MRNGRSLAFAPPYILRVISLIVACIRNVYQAGESVNVRSGQNNRLGETETQSQALVNAMLTVSFPDRSPASVPSHASDRILPHKLGARGKRSPGQWKSFASGSVPSHL